MNTIETLNLEEIAMVAGGTAGVAVASRVFYWAGIAYVIRDLAETAYDIGYWVGSN